MAIARGKEVWEGRYFIMDTYDSQCHEVLLVRKNEKMDIKQTTRTVSPSGSKRPNDLGISTDDWSVLMICTTHRGQIKHLKA